MSGYLRESRTQIARPRLRGRRGNARLCQRNRAFPFAQGHALDESLLLKVPEMASAVAWVTKIALRDHPKRADSGERLRFGSVQRVVAVAIVHQLAVVTVWEVETANEHVSRIEFAIIVPVGSLTATLAGLRVAATDRVSRRQRRRRSDYPRPSQVAQFTIGSVWRMKGAGRYC